MSNLRKSLWGTAIYVGALLFGRVFEARNVLTFQEKMVGRAGLEPATNWLKAHRPNRRNRLKNKALQQFLPTKNRAGNSRNPLIFQQSDDFLWVMYACAVAPSTSPKYQPLRPGIYGRFRGFAGILSNSYRGLW